MNLTNSGSGLLAMAHYQIELTKGGIKQIYDKEQQTPLLNTAKFLGGEVITMRSFGNGAGEFDAVQQPDMIKHPVMRQIGRFWKMVRFIQLIS